MALLTAEEEYRLTEIEDTINKMFTLIDGVGSKTRLNRLWVLFQNDLGKLSARLTTLETSMTEILALARKLQ